MVSEFTYTRGQGDGFSALHISKLRQSTSSGELAHTFGFSVSCLSVELAHVSGLYTIYLPFSSWVSTNGVFLSYLKTSLVKLSKIKS